MTQPNERRVTTPKVSSSEVSALESGLSKLAGVFSAGGIVVSLASAFEGSSNSAKRNDELDRRTIPKFTSTEVSSLSSFFENVGSVFTIGPSGLTIAVAIDSITSNNSTKREIEQAYSGVDLAVLMDEATPQSNGRRATTTPKVSISSLESGLSKLAGVFSVEGTVASLVSAFEVSSNSSGVYIKRSDNAAAGFDSSDTFTLSAEGKHSIASHVLEELISLLGGHSRCVRQQQRHLYQTLCKIQHQCS